MATTRNQHQDPPGRGRAGAAGHRRRAPVQERSRQRIEGILSVAARLVDELGPDEVTTTRIADELGISVGSIYAYFDDRSAIFDAIVARSIAEHNRMVAELRQGEPGSDWFETSFAIIDSLAEVYRTEPGFRAIWFSKHLSPQMLDAMRRMDEVQALAGLAGLARAGLCLDCPSPVDAMRMYVGLIDKGLDLAFRSDPGGNPSVIEETKQVVRHYIGAYLKPLRCSADRQRARGHGLVLDPPGLG